MTERLEGFAIEVGLDTISVNSGLKDLKSSLKTVSSEMRANMSAFDRGDKSVEKYRVQLDGLNKKLEVQKVVTEKARKDYDKMVAAHGEGSKQAEAAAKEYNHQAAELNNLSRYVEGVTEDMKKFEEQQRVAASGLAKFGDKMQGIGGTLTAVGDKMKSAGKNLSMYVTAPLVGLGAIAIKTGIDFDDSMAKVQAVSGATGEDLDLLREKAKEMGAKTKFSASQSAEALNYMAMAGWKTTDMLDGLEGIMDLAAASGEDLGMVSDIVTDGLTAFGLSAKDSGRFADVLAAASANANTNVSMLGKSFEYAAPVAGALGYSVEDTAVALGLMANSGIKADKGGTALRSMLTNLVTPTEKMGTIMEILGVSLTDNEGKMKSLDGIMRDLRSSFSTLTEEQQASYAAQLFGKEAMSGALAVINASEADYNKLTKAVAGSAGAAKEMAGVMEGALGGTIREIQSGLEGFAISMYEEMLPTLEKAADGVKFFVGWLNELSPASKKWIVGIGAAAAAVGPLLVVGGTLAASLGSIFTLVGSVSSAITIMGTGVAAATPLVGGLATMFTVLTGPVGAAIAIVAGLTAGTIALVNHMKKDAIPEVDRFGNGVSDATKKALGGFFELSDGASQQLMDLKINGTKLTTDMATQMADQYREMNAQILDGMKKRHAEELDKTREQFANSSALSDEREAEILRKQQVAFQARETEQKNYDKRISDILRAAAVQNRELTQNEQDQINAIQKTMNENAVKYLTDNERDQKIILENMKNQASDLSARQAADVVKNSAGARDKVIKDAEKTFKDTQSWAIQQRDETGAISAEEADRIIREATKKKDESVKRARDTHTEVVKSAKAQAGDHVKEVNWETGEIMSKWEVYKNDVKKKVKDQKDAVIADSKAMWKWTKDAAEDGRKYVSGKWSDLNTAIKDRAREATVSAGTSFTNMKKDIFTKSHDMYSTVKTKFTGVRDSIVTTLTDSRKKAMDIFAAIATGATQLPGKMKDGIVSMANKAVAGITHVGQKMADKFGAVVNGLVGGLNTITSKLGIGGNIPKWKVPQFAYGTDSHKGGLMVVGDKFGRELVELPDGRTFLSPDTDTLVNAPKGTRVIPNKITEQYLAGEIPFYAGGAGVTDWLKDKAQGFTSALSSIWDYAKHPSKLLDKIPLPSITGLSAGMSDMAKGAVKTVKSAAMDYIKKAFEKSDGEVGAKGPFPSPFHLTSRAGWRIHPIFKTRKFHYGDDWGAPAGTRIPSRSAGRVVANSFHPALGNYVDVQTGPYKFRYQHNSRNLATVGDQVKVGQTLGLVGRTGNSTGNHLHFEIRKNGAFVAPKDMGFATGGRVGEHGLYELSEEGHAEYVIPTAPNRKTEAMKLIALAAREIMGRRGKQNKRPQDLGGGGLLDLGSGQIVQLLLEQNQLLAALLAKDTSVNLDGQELSQALAPGVSRALSQRQGLHNLQRGY